ncbi:MBL fold metallo-hydrolase [Chondrinema litorale]|uniref:MBL fold metallo-hydrolase n=1 Tax=Chondrinema litorale TaxID=2994555 RepID=UPI0025429D4A|nr:MBL fold metallo-hydrolase [Chondrinema litorale]UZR95475.1 MBL fold metallo-hydrolase [Chondrinema litorale]
MIHILDLGFLDINDAIAAFLIETKDGLVLVESGPYSTYKHLVSEVKRVGHQIEDVKHVLLTHIHFDHAGAAWALAEKGAKVYVHPIGYPHMANPEKLTQSARRIYQDDMDRLWSDMKAISEDNLVSVEDYQEINIGEKVFTAHHTPGHAIHHIAWQLDNVLFTGDVAGVKIDDGMVVPPCPPPDINIEDWQSSIERIKDLNVESLYLTHFGKVENKIKHLNELEEMLLSWASWIKPHYENGEKIEDITPNFQRFANQQLTDFGIDEEGLKKYEAANPAFMSVAGLMRYWKKKLQ